MDMAGCTLSTGRGNLAHHRERVGSVCVCVCVCGTRNMRWHSVDAWTWMTDLHPHGASCIHMELQDKGHGDCLMWARTMKSKDGRVE